MELEKCSCCLRYKSESELKVSNIINEKYFYCDKCDTHKAIPLNIANDNIDKLDISHYHVYYRDEYMTIKEYLQKK